MARVKLPSEVYRSVYAPLDAKWTRWEKKFLKSKEGQRMKVSVKMEDGTEVSSPLLKSQRNALHNNQYTS